ncbi:MAG: hypothetical protein Q4C83_03260, partial [Candidatus Saccharibacteria bacterium]|nr:hypothetical protein [Candidatus Saccharibacteria bacterium]
MLLINNNSFGNFCRRIGIDKLYAQGRNAQRQVQLQDIDREIVINSNCYDVATKVLCSSHNVRTNHIGHPVVRLRTGEDVFITHVHRKDCLFWATIVPIGWNGTAANKTRTVDLATLHDEVVGKVVGVTY